MNAGVNAKLYAELRKLIPQLPYLCSSVSIHLDSKNPPIVVVVSEVDSVSGKPVAHQFKLVPMTEEEQDEHSGEEG